MLSKYLNFF